jgi:hypothetical protein
MKLTCYAKRCNCITSSLGRKKAIVDGHHNNNNNNNNNNNIIIIIIIIIIIGHLILILPYTLNLRCDGT